jgi:hypothetical protein
LSNNVTDQKRAWRVSLKVWPDFTEIWTGNAQIQDSAFAGRIAAIKRPKK